MNRSDVGPKDARPNSEEASEQVPQQRSVEDTADSDDSLVRQMSHGDESVVSEENSETPAVVGFPDDHGLENRPEEGTREYDTE